MSEKQFSISKKQAEALADSLIENEKRARKSAVPSLIPLLASLLRARPLKYEHKPSPFVSPASPHWGVMNRETDTSKMGR